MSKGLEALERIIGCSTIESHTKKWQQDYYTIEKELKAIDIIKKKRVNLDYLKSCKTLEDYNNIHIEELQLTQEEYDLLKEVLL